MTSDPTSLALGSHPWPHDDDTPVTGELTYRNSGTDAVTFPVSVEARGPHGEPAPAGLFTVTPTTVTVPAGGAATVTVTADTRVGGVDGAISGAVVAGDLLRTPVGVDREPESYDVTATFVDANGEAPSRHSGLVIGMDNDVFAFFDGEDDTARLRLPKGEYFAFGDVTTGDPEDGRTALLPRPVLVVAGPTALAFDARAAEPVRVTTPDPGAKPVLAEVRVTRAHEGSRVSIGSLFIDGFTDGLTLAGSDPDLPDDQLELVVATQGTGTPVGATPVHHRLAWVERGRVPTGFVRAPARRDLAEVRSHLGPAPAGHGYDLGAAPFGADGSGPMGVLFPVPTGGEAIDYVLGDGFRWRWLLSEHGPDGDSVADYSATDRTYRAGRTHEQRFRFPVFGPGLPPSSYDYLSRHGDVITAQVPLVNDGGDNLGWSVTESARATLHRDGQPVAEVPSASARFTVPPGAARYRLDLDLVRAPEVFDLTTRVTGSWTFRSDTVPGERSRKLPLSVVRFTPRLDADGGTPAGHLLRIPLTVEQQQGADNGRVHKVEVDVSFDDGKTWATVPVVGGAALVRNADRTGYASLRAKGTDSKGNTFEHAVIRAYKIG
ncbi:hypothetical protein ACFXGA_07775 [Actinosynnema sp. NPDC059335]|uniref:hypothetical protein n=1 Tax=Actinosynnema sp. NPDC059335 TaxID=3346804 RepID=UPI00366D7063